ncbi:MAG: Secretion protein HlyD [Parcubacteria group bacterium GW2011_GWD2_43_10]|nr:MAG: Secretion protein HlyD [Parcubacteria group bacterium GW2011_GWD2_43_10]
MIFWVKCDIIAELIFHLFNMWQHLSFLKRKLFWIILVIIGLAVGGIFYQRNKNAQPQYSTESVTRQTLVQTVSATGTVKAAEEVSLNFETTGRLIEVRVSVGDKVSVGQRLASLDTRDSASAILTAEANLKSAQAALDKLQAGAKIEDVAIYEAAVTTAETTLANTKSSQTQAVANALATWLGLPATAIANAGNLSTATITVTGTYQGTEQGSYTIRVDDTASPTFSYFGLETAVNKTGSRVTSVALGARGLNIQFSSTGSLFAGDSWTIVIPNPNSSSYSTYAAAYESALKTQTQQVEAAERALAEAKLKLDQIKSPARSYDILAAEAAVESAQAALIRAQTDLSDKTIIAPVAGTITKVNNQVGETTSIAQPVLVLLAAGNNEIKVQVPESDIAKLKTGQLADITLDAFGSADHFSGHISFIDPASTVIQDVVYYEVTVLFDANDERIKPGMTANVDVTTAELKDVLVIPLRAVKYNEKREAYVELLQGVEVVTKSVQVGLRGDDGLVELVSGLEDGDIVITFKQNGK